MFHVTIISDDGTWAVSVEGPTLEAAVEAATGRAMRMMADPPEGEQASGPTGASPESDQWWSFMQNMIRNKFPDDLVVEVTKEYTQEFKDGCTPHRKDAIIQEITRRMGHA